VPKADVVVTNPTHFAIALRYDRKTMKAPKIVAKGTRLNALRIREIATKNQVPIVENKPLARMMFKYGKVGGRHSGAALRGGRGNPRLRLSRQPLPLLRRAKPRLSHGCPNSHQFRRRQIRRPRQISAPGRSLAHPRALRHGVAVDHVPVPPMALDLFLAISIAISLLILLVILYLEDASDFTGFPTLLLCITLFRLALNVATTR
jgi:hypothetical protein